MKNLPLDQLQIPIPCPQSWELMQGDNSRRFCNQCQKHVTDLSTLSRKNANALLAQNQSQNQSHLCVQILRDSAGRILTAEDIPHPRMTRLRRLATKIVPPFVLALLPFLFSACFRTTGVPTRTGGVPMPATQPTTQSTTQSTLGDVVAPTTQPTPGKIPQL